MSEDAAPPTRTETANAAVVIRKDSSKDIDKDRLTSPRPRLTTPKPCRHIPFTLLSPCCHKPAKSRGSDDGFHIGDRAARVPLRAATRPGNPVSREGRRAQRSRPTYPPKRCSRSGRCEAINIVHDSGPPSPRLWRAPSFARPLERRMAIWGLLTGAVPAVARATGEANVGSSGHAETFDAINIEHDSGPPSPRLWRAPSFARPLERRMAIWGLLTWAVPAVARATSEAITRGAVCERRGPSPS